MPTMADTYIEIPCGCQGVNPACVNCHGAGVVERAACRRCLGKKVEAGTDKRCLDCRGIGYRDLGGLDSNTVSL